MDRACRYLNTLRGERTSAELSATLGYRADPVAEWIAGRKSPSAAETLRVCQVVGVDVHRAFRRFDPAQSLRTVDDAGLAKWIAHLCSRCNLRDVATQMGRSNTTLQRWSSGRVRILLPDFIELVEIITDRSEELLTLLLPTPPHQQTDEHPARAAHRRSSAKRQSAFAALAAAREALARRRQRTPLAAPPRAQTAPISAQFELDELTDPELRRELSADEHTVEVFTSEISEPSYTPDEVTEPIQQAAAPPREVTPAHDERTMRVWQALASDDYNNLDTHRTGWVEARTQLSRSRVQQILQHLEDDGVLSKGQGRYAVPSPPRQVRQTALSASADPLEQLALSRTSSGAWSMSLDDLHRVRDLQQRTPEELNAIEASSSPKEVLVYVQPRWAQSEG